MTAESASALELIEHASLRELNSFGVEAHARWLARVSATDAVPETFALIDAQALPWMALGHGSNLLLLGDFPGVIVQPTMTGIEAIDNASDRVHVRAAAGERWHDLVVWCLDHELYGLENLALIPGSVGASPVQNIGAYGVELERRIVGVEAYDRERGTLVRLAPDQCGFAYRDSRFKREPGRWLITAVELALDREPAPMLDYAGVRAELAAAGITAPSPRQVFETICTIRRRKLPDPTQIGNAGSFFKNPMVPELQAEAIRDHYPDLPTWNTGVPGQTKLSAAWLIEQAGYKGRRDGDAGISDRHALVLVNHGYASGPELWRLACTVRDGVEARFGVRLEPEPRIIDGL